MCTLPHTLYYKYSTRKRWLSALTNPGFPSLISCEVHPQSNVLFARRGILTRDVNASNGRKCINASIEALLESIRRPNLFRVPLKGKRWEWKRNKMPDSAVPLIFPFIAGEEKNFSCSGPTISFFRYFEEQKRHWQKRGKRKESWNSPLPSKQKANERERWEKRDTPTLSGPSRTFAQLKRN